LSEGLAAVGARVGAFFGRGAVGVAVRRVEIRELTIIHIHIHKIPRRNGEEKDTERERERESGRGRKERNLNYIISNTRFKNKLQNKRHTNAWASSQSFEGAPMRPAGPKEIKNNIYIYTRW